MGECMDDEWVNEEGDSFLFDFSRGNKGIYNTIEQRYACILCFKVCTYIHDDTREWMGSSVCGNDERERAVSSFFFSLFFFNFLVFWKNRKKKKVDRKRSRTRQIETHFYDYESFSYHSESYYYYSESKKMRR